MENARILIPKIVLATYSAKNAIVTKRIRDSNLLPFALKILIINRGFRVN